MKPRCSVCSHPEREKLDKDLLSGKSCSEVAMVYFLSDGAVRRHKRHHLFNQSELPDRNENNFSIHPNEGRK